MRKWLPLYPLVVLVTLSLLFILTACAHQIPTPATDGCVAFARLSFSRLHDTTETIQQVKAYDAARDAICGKGK